MSLGRWGPYFWGSLHLTCLSTNVFLTDQEKEAIRTFVDSFTKVLPCPACRAHFAQVLSDVPLEPALENGPDLFRWSVAVHNEVNKSIGKPIVSVDDAYNYWLNAMSIEKVNKVYIDQVTFLVIIVMLVLLAFFFVRKT